jgi:membrane associated rhomboid family serine protease
VLPLRDDTPSVRLPVVTVAIIVVNIAVYFLVQPRPDSVESQRFLVEHAAIPCELQSGEPLTASEFVTGTCDATATEVTDSVGQQVSVPDTPLFPDKNVYLAVLWSMFLHGSLFHLLGNMLFLWIFGNNVEDRFGHVPYVLFYLLAGAAATAAHVLGNADATVPLIGASGAIAGVMGAYLIWYPSARVLTLLGWFLVELPAAVVLGLWFVLQFATNPNSGVAWLAHVGGFIVGAALALALSGVFAARTPRLAPPAWHGFGEGPDRDRHPEHGTEPDEPT